MSTTTNPDARRPDRPSRLALGLGGNLGETRWTFRRTLDQLAQRLGPLEVAPLYRTAPISPIPQPDYLNTAVLAAVPAGSPHDLLAFLKDLERAAGRDPEAPRWGPRPLDLDLLLWGEREISTPELTVPHPRLRERRFVLAPLADLAPDFPVPPDGISVAEWLARLEDDPQAVTRVSWEE
ncbi:MAG: 2-amino-4-hydroxy-6-hydroxymethyldihydropteridine diphosphokinase [Thermoanaerobaculia bacterium]|nr:2-amino-4-hydroxy-6-hydroxymethyldihydropteridine diphosphokinase [Thermoanaerobaculia bacterium]